MRFATLMMMLFVTPLLSAADPLAKVRNETDLDAVIRSTTDAKVRKAIEVHVPQIAAAAARKPHVDFVAEVLTNAKGSFERINTTPEALAKALGGPSVLFDSLSIANLGSTELGIKAKRDIDPFDQVFYERLGQIDTVSEIIILHTVCQNAWLAPLAKMKSLKSLRIINQAKLNDEGLALLAPLKQLESFAYIGTSMTGEPFKDFIGWNSLKRTSHRGSKMTSDGLTSLCRAFPNLESLILAHGFYTDDAVANLASLKNLTALEIGSPKATPQCLKHIAGLPLQYLQLGDGLDASAGIAIVKDIKTLKRLTLTNCLKATDDDLKSVAGMKHLENLELSNIVLTEDRLPLLKEFGFLKSLRITQPKQPFAPEMQAKIKEMLPSVALKFE